jgi:hypothetical protein
MHWFVGAICLVAGLSCLRYGWTGAPSFEREPPFLALGVLFVGAGVGLWLRVRAASLLARVGVIGALVWVVVKALRQLGGAVTGADADEALVAHAYLFGNALAAGGLVLAFLLLRRVKSAPTFGGLDLVPLGGLALAAVLAIIWLVSDDARLRPCRLGNHFACGQIARGLLEAADRTPTARPSRGAERAGRLLMTQPCPVDEPMLCGAFRYAAGTVEARAGRAETAKEGFLAACEIDRNWCARAAQGWRLPWTADEQARIARP